MRPHRKYLCMNNKLQMINTILNKLKDDLQSRFHSTCEAELYLVRHNFKFNGHLN